MSFNPFSSIAELYKTAMDEGKNVLFRRTESGIGDALVDAEFDGDIYSFDRQGKPVDKDDDDD
ncbi:MAG: hypothetical protein ACE5I1_12445 [bacterium]